MVFSEKYLGVALQHQSLNAPTFNPKIIVYYQSENHDFECIGLLATCPFSNQLKPDLVLLMNMLTHLVDHLHTFAQSVTPVFVEDKKAIARWSASSLLETLTAG